jgi:putative tryptophan/tyrosine transport system substrate-binding protein
MRLKFVALLLANSILVSSYPAEAQQPTGKLPRIGFVAGTASPSVRAFQQGLRDLGYLEGKNILIEYRFTEGKEDRIASVVEELLQLKLDVLVSL